MHAHSRAGSLHALSSGESEIMSSSELLKEAKGLQHLLEFVGFGTLPIHMSTDATVARNFMHRKGAGRMKHLDIRFMWLQEECANGKFVPKKVPRDVNPSDMLTKTPNTEEVKKFTQMIGLFPFKQLVNNPLKAIGAVLKQAKGIAKCALIASLFKAVEGADEIQAMSVSTCILESDWMSKIVPCLLTVIMLMGTYIWRLLREHKELEKRIEERRSSGVRNLEQSRLMRPKMKDEVEDVERNFKVPDVVVITESGECYHRSTCSYVKARAKGKAKSRSRKLRPCTVCFPMERKLSGDPESASYHERTQSADDLLETDIA